MCSYSILRLALAKAMLQIQDNSCIEFVGKEDGDVEHLHFVTEEPGCFVNVDREGTRTVNMQESECLVREWVYHII